MGAGLWEVRTDLDSNRIAPILFCFAEGQMILLHGFMKKMRKTSKPDLDLARARQKEVER
jgi:phage-related protein